MGVPRPLLLIVLVLAFKSAECLSQTVRGTIRDSTTNQTIANAQVTLLDLQGDTVATDRSTNDGGFLLSAPRWGRYILSTLRLGYRPVTIPDLVLNPGDSVRTELWMEALPIEMDPVEVTAEAAVQVAHARYLQEEGFYHRERATVGRHLDPQTIEKRRSSARYIDDYLTGLPGVRVRQSSSAGSRRRVTLRSCTPTFFVDGVRHRGGRIEDAINPYDVLAIEVYSSALQTQEEYGGRCAVVVWSRRTAELRMRP